VKREIERLQRTCMNFELKCQTLVCLWWSNPGDRAVCGRLYLKGKLENRWQLPKNGASPSFREKGRGKRPKV
jgi:hypothetical protein